ncbi:MAG: NFACT family protein, partial [Clostridia bacterium]|nr:NFACT family protein [Clostridia bacterium]
VFSPCVILDPKTEKPMDFSPVAIRQYGNATKTETTTTLSDAMNVFFQLRDHAERMRQRTSSILHILTNHLERCHKKTKLQEETRLELENREQLKIYGDLLIANLYQIQSGATSVTLPNYYAEDGKEITIDLDPQKTPSQNAQQYYKQYNKAKNAEIALVEQERINNEETAYLESVFDALSRANSPAEIAEIREELQEQGYVKRTPQKRKSNSKAGEPMRFISSDGFVILTGRNNRQNDYVTLKLSRAEDIWFHTKNIPGSHTLIKSGGTEVPQQTLLEAAIIASYHSKAGASSNVPVDFTPVKNVKKPAGAKPGMVIYDHYHTLYVTPDEALVEKLKEH